MYHVTKQVLVLVHNSKKNFTLILNSFVTEQRFVIIASQMQIWGGIWPTLLSILVQAECAYTLRLYLYTNHCLVQEPWPSELNWIQNSHATSFSNVTYYCNWMLVFECVIAYLWYHIDTNFCWITDDSESQKESVW